MSEALQLSLGLQRGEGYKQDILSQLKWLHMSALGQLAPMQGMTAATARLQPSAAHPLPSKVGVLAGNGCLRRLHVFKLAVGNAVVPTALDLHVPDGTKVFEYLVQRLPLHILHQEKARRVSNPLSRQQCPELQAACAQACVHRCRRCSRQLWGMPLARALRLTRLLRACRDTTQGSNCLRKAAAGFRASWELYSLELTSGR